MGMASTTNRAAPSSKLRVTCLSCRALLPQCAHRWSTGIDVDDDKFAGEANFDDRLCRLAAEGDALDDVLEFTSLGIALTGGDLAREVDVFEVEDSNSISKSLRD